MLFDTTFFIDLHRRDQAAVELWSEIIDGRTQGSYSPITTLELWLGNMSEEEAAFYDNMFVLLSEAALTKASAKEAAGWIKSLPNNYPERLLRDAMIAATASESDTVLYTRNVRDHSRFPIRVQSY